MCVGVCKIKLAENNIASLPVPYNYHLTKHKGLRGAFILFHVSVHYILWNLCWGLYDGKIYIYMYIVLYMANSFSEENCWMRQGWHVLFV